MSLSAETIAQTARAAFEASQLMSELEVVDRVVVQRAEAEVAAGRLASPLVKRLDLRTGEKWDMMLQVVTDIASLPDPRVPSPTRAHYTITSTSTVFMPDRRAPRHLRGASR
ncbi:hypothetical protein BGY98DRAFT_940619, partial [Russula aff. rugulosa BPL654]